MSKTLKQGGLENFLFMPYGNEDVNVSLPRIG